MYIEQCSDYLYKTKAAIDAINIETLTMGDFTIPLSL